MAIAGLCNVSAFGPLFAEDHSPGSPVCGEGLARPSSQTSSLLQMWRELEDEQLMSPHRQRQQRNNAVIMSVDAYETENQGLTTGEDMNHEDNESVISEQSSGAEGRSRDRVQVHDRIVNNHSDSGVWRPVRRLCGRQTLLDLLKKAQSERSRELQELTEQRPVTDFTHRNRIQALLRGRFLRNQISMHDKRQFSGAATELGFLGQRHTVSDLREGFLSKLQCSVSTPINCGEPSSSGNDENNGEVESTCIEREAIEIDAALDLGSAADENRNQNELDLRVTEVEDSVLVCEANLQEMSLDVERTHSVEDPTLAGEASEQEVSTSVELIGNRHFEQNSATLTNESSLESANINYSGPHEVALEHCEPISGASHVHELAGDTAVLEGSTNEEFGRQDETTQAEEVQDSELEIEGNVSHQPTSVSLTEWTEVSREDMLRSWQETSANQWFQETSDYDAVGQDQVQESREDWLLNHMQEASDSSLVIPTEEINSPVRNTGILYAHDNDNDHSMELRELLSRRRVYSLLRSSFRESLDQVLQSHVERQGDHASRDWEEDIASSPTVIEHDPEQLTGVNTSALSDHARINSVNPLSNHMALSQSLWDEELRGTNWPHNSDLHLGTEWELINDLRVDVARLQLRMNSMQSMLEACLALQIELQRSVHQEVSAALNHSTLSRDSSNTLHNESQWDSVRKGICCLCYDSKINSLLYRCGHMCTCSKCAEVLVQGTGKCPMCRAPVVEVVRAYFIQ